MLLKIRVMYMCCHRCGEQVSARSFLLRGLKRIIIPFSFLLMCVSVKEKLERLACSLLREQVPILGLLHS